MDLCLGFSCLKNNSSFKFSQTANITYLFPIHLVSQSLWLAFISLFKQCTAKQERETENEHEDCGSRVTAGYKCLTTTDRLLGCSSENNCVYLVWFGVLLSEQFSTHSLQNDDSVRGNFSHCETGANSPGDPMIEWDFFGNHALRYSNKHVLKI